MLNPVSLSPVRTVTGFLSQFLQTRQLTAPTGLPLYAYKISDDEYQTLKRVLTHNREQNSQSAACFVLFAADWWRRHYDGGHWEWEPIFGEICRPDLNNGLRRKELLEKGCRYWQRSVFQHEGGSNSFLGTIVFEAGLPVQLLTGEGYIRALLLRALAFIEHNRISMNDAIELIREQARRLVLPDVLMVTPFFELIYAVVSALLALKKSHALAQKEQPVAYLNLYVPGWQERLPVRLDDGPNAETFLESLLLDVAKTPRPETPRIGVTYTLTCQSANWTLKTTLTIPPGVYAPEELHIKPDDFARLSEKVLIKVVYTGGEKLLGYGFKNRNSQMDIRGLSAVKLPDSIYASPWHVVVADSQTDEPMGLIELPYGNGLDPALPWVFVPDPQQNTVGLLKRVGSTRLSANKALVVCPAHLIPDSQSVQHRGTLNQRQMVYELAATSWFRDAHDDDQAFRVRLAEVQDDDDFYYVLHHQSNAHRIMVFPGQNAGIFLGFPRIRKIHKTTGYRITGSDQIQYKLAGQWQKLTNPDALTGRFRVRCIGREGDVLFSQEISVLPLTLAISFQPASRSIVLTNTGGLRVSLETGLDAVIDPENTGYRIRLPSGHQAITKLKITLSPTDSGRSVTLIVPAPADSGYFVDGDDQPISANQSIDFQRLYGARLVLNNVSGQEQTRQICLMLTDRHNPDAARIMRLKKISLGPFSTTEIPLIRYKPDLEELLSFTQNVDATVRIQHGTGSSIQVAQYTHKPSYDPPTRTVTLNQTGTPITGVTLVAFPLDTPFTPDKLTELTATEAGWAFPETATGKWLYFAAKTSASNVRPAVAVLVDDFPEITIDAVDGFHQATNHRHQNRQIVLKNLFDQISTSFDNANWQTLQHLYDCTRHLSLNALDVWKALVKSDRGLAAFFLQFDTLCIEKLSREFSVNWYAIPVSVWLDVLGAYRNPEQNPLLTGEVAEMILTAKIQAVETGLCLNSLGQIIGIEIMNRIGNQDFKISRYAPCVQPIIEGAVLGGLGSPGLIHQTKAKFPIHLSAELLAGFAALPDSVRALMPVIPAGFGYLRPVAYLPVLMAYHSVCPDALPVSAWDKHRLRQLMAFDTDYFCQIYNFTQAFCWQNLTH